MRIAIAKPDWGVTGGFEFILRRLETALVSWGHTVEWILVDVPKVSRTPFGVPVPGEIWERCFEFFRYLAMVEAFRAIDARSYDVLLSTQPPSFAVEHPRHLALFYHHLRIYYDLSDAYVAAGFVDPTVHERARDAALQVDSPLLAGVTRFLAASEVVQERLATFNGLTGNVSVFHAGTGMPEELVEPGDEYEHPLCVSRHEFPKRTELFVHAMKFLPDAVGTVVGTGGRLPWVRQIDALLSERGADLEAVRASDLWLCRGEAGPEAPFEADSNVRFLGHVEESELAGLYRSALCVVAPAYLEDYGLTAIEAMAFGKPVVVCRDGGGLVDFVKDGVTGFVVEPTGPAIAEAVRRFREDPSLARAMGAAALEASRRYTWDRALREVAEGLAQVAT